MKHDYDQVRRDFEALEDIAELEDQVDLDADREALMQNPTKAFAAKMYYNGILLWLAKHGGDAAPDIAERYRR